MAESTADSWSARLQTRLSRLANELASRYEIQIRHLKGRAYRGWAFTEAGRRVIECPPPRGYVSFAIFCHEVGHHLLDHSPDPRPSPEEELAAWGVARQIFTEHRLRWTDGVSNWARKSLAECIDWHARQGKKNGSTPPLENSHLRAIRLLENAGL